MFSSMFHIPWVSLTYRPWALQVRSLPAGISPTQKVLVGRGYGCFHKWWYPQIIHFNRVFHYKPSILGYPYFWKHPYGEVQLDTLWNIHILNPTSWRFSSNDVPLNPWVPTIIFQSLKAVSFREGKYKTFVSKLSINSCLYGRKYDSTNIFASMQKPKTHDSYRFQNVFIFDYPIGCFCTTEILGVPKH